MALLIFSHIIMILIFEVSDTLVQLLRSTAVGLGSVNSYLFVRGLFSWDSAEKWICLIMLIYMIWLTIVFFISYLKRFFFVCILTVFAPLFSIMYALSRKTKQIYSSWLKEYMCIALIQPFHMIIYYVLISLPLTLLKGSGGFIDMAFDIFEILYVLLAMSFIKPAEKYLRSLFGMDQGIAKVASYDSGKQTIDAVKKTVITTVKTAVQMAVKAVKSGSDIAKGEGEAAATMVLGAVAGAAIGSVVPGAGTAAGAAAGAATGTTAGVATTVAVEGGMVAAEGAAVAVEGTAMAAEGATIAAEGAATVAEGVGAASEGAAIADEGITALAEGGEVIAEGGEFFAEGATDSGMFDVSDGSGFETNSDDLLEKGIRKGVKKSISGSGTEDDNDGSTTIGDGTGVSPADYVEGDYGGDASRALGTTGGKEGSSAEVLGTIDFSDSGMKEAIAQGVEQGNKQSEKKILYLQLIIL